MAVASKSLLTSRRLALSVLALGVVAVSAAGVTLYLRREAIGVRLAFDYLRSHGVPADIRLDRLDLGGASGTLRLGPPGRPDLTVARIEAQFGALPAPWRGVRPPPVRSLTLIQPVLRLAWRGGRLDFGSLQPLVDQAMRAKGGGGPAPDLHVRDGRLLLDSPAGPVVVALDADLQDGRVRQLHARLQPADLTAMGVRLAGVQGIVSGSATGRGLLHLSGAFSAERGAGDKGVASGLTLTLEGVAPNGAATAEDAPARALDATVRLRAVRLALRPERGEPVRVQTGDLTLDLDGAVDGSGRFDGKLQAAGRAGRLERGGLQLASAALTLGSPAAEGRLGPHGLEAVGPYALSAQAGGGALRLGEGMEAALLPFRLEAHGRLDLARRVRLEAVGEAEGGAGLAAPDAEALARRAVGGIDPPSAAPLARALRRVVLQPAPFALDYDSRTGATLRLDRGLEATVDGGALTLRPEGRAALLQTGADGAASGAFRLALQATGLPYVAVEARRYRLDAGGSVRAEGAAQLEGGFGPADGASVRLAGALAGSGRRWSFTPEGCAALSASAVRSGDGVAATGVKVQACPSGAEPLLVAAPEGWRVRTEMRGLVLASPGAAVKAVVDEAGVRLDGTGRSVAGQVLVHRALLEDTGPSARVRPLSATGAVSFSGGEARGRLAVALAQGGVPLGVLDVDARAGGGQATLDTGPLRFAQHGLQPGDIAPALAHVLPQADGTVELVGRYAWSASGAASSGELTAAGLSFRSPAGRLDGARGVVRLSSLSPLSSAGPQTLAADRLETVIPLTDLRLAYALGPAAIELQAASAEAAGGRLSLGAMRLPLAPQPFATSGVLQLKGVDLQQVIATLNLANSVRLQAKVDGRLPFAIQPAPGGGAVLRLADGRVAADGPGRLTIARQALRGAVATGGAAGAQPNAVQDFAYQALENLAFSTLEADVASRAGGRLGVVFHVVGRHDPPSNPPTRIGLFALLRGRAFDKPLPLPKGTPVDLTLDTSLNLDDILNTYAHLGGSAAVHP